MNVEGRAVSVFQLRHRTVFSSQCRELAAGILGTLEYLVCAAMGQVS